MGHHASDTQSSTAAELCPVGGRKAFGDTQSCTAAELGLEGKTQCFGRATSSVFPDPPVTCEGQGLDPHTWLFLKEFAGNRNDRASPIAPFENKLHDQANQNM